MTECELGMERGHVAQRGEAFKHIVVANLEMVDDPSRVEMSRDQLEGAVQVFGERSSSLLVELIGRHAEAELDAYHCGVDSIVAQRIGIQLPRARHRKCTKN
jgi:hypothetical protein